MPKGVRQTWTRRKRVRRADESETQNVVERELIDSLRSALVRSPSLTEFNMNCKSARIELAKAMWAGIAGTGERAFMHTNAELVGFLEVLLRNTYTSRAANNSGAVINSRKQFRIESVLTILARAQSQKRMPLLTARLTCAAYRIQMPHTLWRIFSVLNPGLLASFSWIDKFLSFAIEFRPPCPYETLPLVGGVMFDNYSRKVLYSSQATVEKHGYMLNMTNWATFHIPSSLSLPDVDYDALCACALT